MAGAFKTPCPSCEADVLVKGANLIGRKIDCPKCKYRFTVPSPDGSTDDGFEVVDKPKKKANSKSLVGVALGVVAIAALAVGGFMMFGGDEESPKPSPVTRRPANPITEQPVTPDTTPGKKGNQPVNAQPGNGQIVDPNDIFGKPKDPTATAPKAEVLAPPAKMKDATNLLPGQSVTVVKLALDRLRSTPLYGAFFDKSMLDFFQTSMTFEAADLDSVHICLVDADRDPFVLIRTKKPISLTGITQKMDIELAENSPINQRIFYRLKSNPFVMAMSRTFSSETLMNDAGMPITAEDKKRWQEKPMGLYYYDSQTLVIGEMNIMMRWLGELNAAGDPPYQSIIAPKTAPAEGAPVDPAAAAAPPSKIGEEGGRGGRGGEVAPQPPPGGAEPGKLFADKADYLSLRPELKSMLDALSTDEKNQPAIMVVDMIDQRSFFKDDFGAYDQFGIILSRIAPAIKILGAGIHQINKDKLNCTVLFSFISEQDTKDTVQQFLLPILNNYLPVLAEFFRTDIKINTELQSEPGNNQLPGGRGGSGTGRGDATQTPGNDFADFRNKSTIDITISDRLASFGFDFSILSDHYNTVLLPMIRDLTTQIKGRMQVLSGDTNWHSLSTRFVRLARDKKAFPQGALPRVSKPERFGLPWQPDDRASFIVDLLPYLNQGALYGGLMDQERIRKTAWYDKKNLRAAGTWIPQLLVPYYPQTSWRAYHPAAAGETLGATNFVALAGVGRDSARFDPANPEHTKLVGITGYNWGSKPAEIRDGMSNTIYMIQVPPGHNRPWIAGGGATVMGVDPVTPVQDFVSKDATGKRGTHALMADGSVRYVPEGMDGETFKAMVTRAGGETMTDLDKKAAIVPPPKNLEAELKGGASGPNGKKGPDRSRIDQPELLKLQGKWAVTYMFFEGKPKTASELDDLSLVVTISDNTMLLTPKDGTAQKKMILGLDPKADPKRIYFENADGNPDPMIYVLDGDKIKLLGWMKADAADNYPKEMTPPTSGAKDVKYYEFTKVKQ